MKVSPVTRSGASFCPFRSSFTLPSSSRALAQSSILLRGRGRQHRHGAYFVPKDKISNPHLDLQLITLEDVATGWNQKSKRSGVIAVKIGMTSELNEFYEYMPLTVLQLLDCEVIRINKFNKKAGEVGLQVGAENAKPERIGKGMRIAYHKAGASPKKMLMEFTVSENAQLKPGTELRAEHFVPGQYLDLQAITIGKGFQGVMKRWGFGGGSASHGNSRSHRIGGSTGQHTNPSKVFKGKKMAGRMGGDKRTIRNLMLWKIDTRLNLIYVKGQVPGSRGAYVRVMDSFYKPFPFIPPYPTYQKQPGEILPEIITANTPEPQWWKKLEAREILYEEDPSKNKDDDPSIVNIVRQYRDEFPTLEKWRKGLLPPGPHPSKHPSCATAGVTLEIPWIREIIARSKEERKKSVWW